MAREQAPRAKPAAVSRAPQAQAIEKIIGDATKKREGTRHISLGGTGRGKTWFLKKLVGVASRRVDVVLVHDVKDRAAQYPGQTYANVAHVPRNPPKSGNILVFRDENPELVARFGWRLGTAGKTSLVLVDEIYDALSSPMHFAARPSTIDEIARKGRSRGVSFVGTTQVPQSLPTVLIDLADTKSIFGMDSRSLNYVESALRLDRRATAAISRLSIGEFILIEQGRDWDGIVYGPQ
jgi:hypothetical protein